MDNYLKRKINTSDEGDTNAKKNKMEVCPHGERCFRRNPHHFKEYNHPHLIKFMSNGLDIPDGLPQPKAVYKEQINVLKSVGISGKSVKKTDDPVASGSSSSVKNTASPDNLFKNKRKQKSTSFVPSSDEFSNKTVSPGSMLEKLQKAAPYNLFFTTIPKSPATLTHPNSITFTDLLCPSLGKLKCSLQFNFMIDVSWLMEQYKARNVGDKPLTILCADEFPKMQEYINRFLPNVTCHFVKLKDPFGTHHSKVGVYVYEDHSIRIVISTANLYYEDWNLYNQGLWVSPLCPKLPEGSSPNDGESPTGFKRSFLRYLQHYSLPLLKQWIDYVSQADFSRIKVFLVTSVPGKDYPANSGSHLHRVGDLLTRHCKLPAKTTPESEGPLCWGIIAQSSSLGTLGKSASDWLRSCLLRSLAGHCDATLTTNSSASLSVIFPSVDNVASGYWGLESGGCLPYSKAVNEKQRWFQSYLHQWKADKLQRTRAMPHIKTYCRVSPCLTKLAWFLITSSNISKSAWGGNITKEQSVYVRSYEVGVMFLPKFFDEEYFEIEQTSSNKNEKMFPFIYDLPLTSYSNKDYPWCN